MKMRRLRAATGKRAAEDDEVGLVWLELGQRAGI